MALTIDSHALGQQLIEPTRENHITVVGGRGREIEHERMWLAGQAERNRVGAQHGFLAAEWRDHAAAAREMHTGESGARDFLGVIGTAPGKPTVVHADDGEAAGLSFFQREFCRAIHSVETRIVAAVHARRHGRFVFDTDWRARLFEIDVLGNREDAREAQRGITAEFSVDLAGGNDRGFFGGEADVLQRAMAEFGRFGFG